MRYLNISMDDVSPHPLSSTKVLKNCFKVLEKHPQCKFTLFVPTAYWRTMITGDIDTTTKYPLHLHEHQQFCDELIALPKENFEVCYHGKYHGIPGKSNNDEFRHLSGEQFKNLWHQMKLEMQTALRNDDKIKNVIRPPGMYMSPDAIDAVKNLDIDCVALSKMSHHVNSYSGRHETLDNAVYANVWPPFTHIENCLDEKLEVLYHACEWDKGYLNDELTDRLIQWLDSNHWQTKFVFIEQLLDV